MLYYTLYPNSSLRIHKHLIFLMIFKLIVIIGFQAFLSMFIIKKLGLQVSLKETLKEIYPRDVRKQFSIYILGCFVGIVIPVLYLYLIPYSV